jgi:DNA-binding SARP family transcriptional activator/TolB-like protein
MRTTEADIDALRPSLQLLGTFRLSQSGGTAPLPGRKARAILAYLVLAPGHSATREQLAGLLWSDRGPDQARASLRQSLKELRELPTIGSTLATERDAVVLDEAAVAVDLHEIRDAAAARDLATLARLLERTRGDLLEDFLDLSPAFDEWLEAERPRQHDLVLADSLDALEADGLADMKNARSILRSLDRLDPVNEAVVRLGMRLDHAVGDGASLHRRYRQLCGRLDSEFGALPSEETRALFHALAPNRNSTPPLLVVAQRVAEPAPAQPAPGNGDTAPLVMVAALQTGAEDGPLVSLAEFCADDIRVSLSHMRGIQVLGLDGSEVPEVLRQAEDALGLYLLSGSLRRFGAEYRANLQLADAGSRIILWSDSLRLGESEEAALEALVGKAAGAVVPAIDRDLDRRLRQAAVEFDGERALYTRARLLIRSEGSLAAVREGVRLLERLLEINPRHLGAHLLLCRMYDSDFWQQLAGHDVGRFRALADHHCRTAAAIEPGHYAVRIRQAWRHARTGQTAAAQREFEAVLAHLSHDADATNQCAMGFCFIGQLDRAEQLMQRAFYLNPFPSSDYHADLAAVLALAGEPETAEEHFAVSGETGLMYAAVRIANAAHLDRGADRIAPILTDFVAAFRQAWQPEDEPALTSVLDWAGYTLPLNRPEHMDWLTQGLRQMLEPSWPAASGNGR